MDDPILRFTGYLVASVASVLLVGSLIVASWYFAWPRGDKSPSRVRWHMVTKNKIEKGTQIKADDVTWMLGRVAESEPLIPVSKTVVGKYAVRDIEANSTCVPDALSDLALASPPKGGAVVPVEVKTSDISSLKPGMLLAFVHPEKGVVLPKTTLLHKQVEPGLELLSMSTSTKDPGTTTLLVKIGKSELEAAPLLVAGVWRPVILGQLDETPAPAETKPTKKTPRRQSRRRR